MKSCSAPGCYRPKATPKHFCYWHSLLRQPIEAQREAAILRFQQNLTLPRARVPQSEWPAGERWCAGCQSFVPLFYTTGSRCKACASVAAHNTRLKATYGIDREEYEALLEVQGGRCYICQREVHSKRLAVDHDHQTGAVRGLLCADRERGCNHAILGNIRDVEMARRIVDYLEDPPYARLCRERGVEPQQKQTPNERTFVGETPRAGRSVVAEILQEAEAATAPGCRDPQWHPDFCGCR